MYMLLPQEVWYLVFDFSEVRDIKSALDTCKVLNSWYWDRVLLKGHKGDTIVKWYPNLVSLTFRTTKAISYGAFLSMIKDGKPVMNYERKDLDLRYLEVSHPNGYDKPSLKVDHRAKSGKKVKCPGIYDLYLINQAAVKEDNRNSSHVLKDVVLANPYIDKDTLDRIVRNPEVLGHLARNELLANKALTTEQITHLYYNKALRYRLISHRNLPIKLLPNWMKEAHKAFGTFWHVSIELTDDELAVLVSELPDEVDVIMLRNMRSLSRQVCRDILHCSYSGRVRAIKYYKSPLLFSDMMKDGVFNELALQSSIPKFLSKMKMTMSDILTLWTSCLRFENSFWFYVSSNPCVTSDMIKANPVLTWDINGLLINPSISLKDMLDFINRRYK